MEATPIISPPAKKHSMVRQLDLRVTKTPNGRKGVHKKLDWPYVQLE